MQPLSRRNVISTAIGFSVALTLPSRGHAQPSDDPTLGRSLAFADDFDRLDQTIWHAGPKVNSLEPGYYGRSAFAGHDGAEGFIPYSIIDDPLASNGKALQLSAKYIGKPMKIPHYFGNLNPETQWISANLQSAKPDGTINKGWRRGYFETRMRFPRHPLSWPAFWMLNGRSILFSKTSVELDVVEHKGWEPNLYGSYLHEWGEPGARDAGTGVPTEPDMTEGYHRYGIVVDDDYCAPYFDRKPVLQMETQKPAVWKIGRSAQLDANKDVFFPLLTLALHAGYPFPNPLRQEDKLVHMQIDYFHVYV